MVLAQTPSCWMTNLKGVIVSSAPHIVITSWQDYTLSYILRIRNTRRTHRYSNRRKWERYKSGEFIFIDENIWNIIGRGRVRRNGRGRGLTASPRICYRIRRNSGMFTWMECQSAKMVAIVRSVSYRAFFNRSHCNWHSTSTFLSRPWDWNLKSEETCEVYTAWSLSSSQSESFRCPSDHSSMEHCTYWQRNSNSVSIKHLVGESCSYHCEHKSDDWNGHRGEVLVMQNSHIILGTKQRHINGLLEDRMAVLIMTFPAVPSLLLAKWGQCAMSRGETETGPNRIDEIHIFQ